MLITRPNLRNDRWHPWPFFRRLFDAAVSKSTLLVVLPVSWTFSQVSTSSGVAGNHRRSPNFLSQADSWKDKKRAYALLFGKATRDDVQWTSLITHWSLGDCVSIAAISDSCDMQQRCAQRCDIQIFLHIIYIYIRCIPSQKHLGLRIITRPQHQVRHHVGTGQYRAPWNHNGSPRSVFIRIRRLRSGFLPRFAVCRTWQSTAYGKVI